MTDVKRGQVWAGRRDFVGARLTVLSVDEPAEGRSGFARVRYERGSDAQIEHAQRLANADGYQAKNLRKRGEQQLVLFTNPREEVHELAWFREWKKHGRIVLEKESDS